MTGPQQVPDPDINRRGAERLDVYRTLWARTRSSDVLGQSDIDWLFGVMSSGEASTPLPKGHSEPTMMLVRAAFDEPQADWSAAEIADLVPTARRGTGYGLFTAVYGLAWLAGATIIGALYGSSLTALFVFVAVLQVAALVVFVPLIASRHQVPTASSWSS